MIVYSRYVCGYCGKATRHQNFVLTCQLCQVPICKRCAKGGFCKICHGKLPSSLRRKYDAYRHRWTIFGWAVVLLFLFLGLYSLKGAPAFGTAYLTIFAGTAFLTIIGPRSTRKSTLRKARRFIYKWEELLESTIANQRAQTGGNGTAESQRLAGEGECPFCFGPVPKGSVVCPLCGHSLL